MLYFSMNTSQRNTEAGLLDQYIQDISGGDQKALGKLYEQTSPAIYGFALSIVKNTQDAVDIHYAYQPAVTDEDRMVLEAMLSNLKDEERQIVLLHSITGLKHREIATLMECLFQLFRLNIVEP